MYIFICKDHTIVGTLFAKVTKWSFIKDNRPGTDFLATIFPDLVQIKRNCQ